MDLDNLMEIIEYRPTPDFLKLMGLRTQLFADNEQYEIAAVYRDLQTANSFSEAKRVVEEGVCGDFHLGHVFSESQATLAWDLCVDGDVEGSLQCALLCLCADETHVYALKTAAISLAILKRYGEGCEVLKEAYQYVEPDADDMVMLGQLALAAGDINAATSAFRTAVITDPEETSAGMGYYDARCKAREGCGSAPEGSALLDLVDLYRSCNLDNTTIGSYLLIMGMSYVYGTKLSHAKDILEGAYDLGFDVGVEQERNLKLSIGLSIATVYYLTGVDPKHLLDECRQFSPDRMDVIERTAELFEKRASFFGVGNSLAR